MNSRAFVLELLQEARDTRQLKYLGLALGAEAEEQVANVLMEMRETGEIKDFYQTEKDSKQDQKGIDFVVFVFGCWVPMPLQVKRSGPNARIHRKKYPHIPVVSTKSGNILRGIRKAINDFSVQRSTKRLEYKHLLEKVNQ